MSLNCQEISVTLVEHKDNLPIPANLSPHSPSQSSRKRRVLSTTTYNKILLDIEKPKLQLLQDKSKQKRKSDKENEHLLFFKSLLPHIGRISHHRLLSYRSRVQEIVYILGTSPHTSVSSYANMDMFTNLQLYRSSVTPDNPDIPV